MKRQSQQKLCSSLAIDLTCTFEVLKLIVYDIYSERDLNYGEIWLSGKLIISKTPVLDKGVCDNELRFCG